MGPHIPVGMLGLILAFASPAYFTADEAGYEVLFNGKDLTGWTLPEGDNGHWKVVDKVIDYDARSE